MQIKARAPGLPPGHMEYTGTTQSNEKAILHLFRKNTQPPAFNKVGLDELVGLGDKPFWLDVEGLHDTQTIEQLAQQFEIHPLIMEDLVNTVQRPKLEMYDNYLFLVLQIPIAVEGDSLEAQQISFLLSKNRLFTFREVNNDPFTAARDRLKRGGGRLAKNGLDYLAYALLDNLLDNCSLVFQGLEDQVENLEIELDAMTEPDEVLLAQIHRFRKQIISSNRTIRPLRDICGELFKSSRYGFEKSTKVYLRDVYDHAIRLCDILESTRERLKDMVDLYLSYLSHHTNRVMQTFTMLGGIFIPLTFVAGVYGMNFTNMPELSWKYGYPFALGIMGCGGIGIYLFLRFKKWL